MLLAANIAIAFVALIHVYILVLEMFLWTTPTGMKAFNLTAEFAQQSKVLAANQGLYNGFLAAGLLFGLLVGGDVGTIFKAFFLTCVIVAGLYGAATASKKILFIQTIPASIASLLLWAAR